MDYIINKDLVVFAPKGVKVDLGINEKVNASFIPHFLKNIFGVENGAIEFNHPLATNLKRFYFVKIDSKTFVFDRILQCITSEQNVKFSLLY